MTVALHGFLGLPEDWSSLPNAQAVNLWAETPIPFWDWASAFNKKYSGALIGYSMGGRLALHALIDNPCNWEKAVIVSAHPGLAVEQRPERVNEDLVWADRFMHEPWEQLLHSWNSRSTFTHDQPVQRFEKDYNRSNLAQALKVWSRGNQDKLHEKIAELPMPITWMVGELDTTYVAEALSLKFRHPQSEVIILPGLGHRIPLQRSLLESSISF